MSRYETFTHGFKECDDKYYQVYNCVGIKLWQHRNYTVINSDYARVTEYKVSHWGRWRIAG